MIINRLDNYGDRKFSAYQYDFIRNKNQFAAYRTLEFNGRHCEEKLPISK